MNEFEKAVCERIGEKRYQRISSVCVGIIGCGGLGSNASVCLARSGFKHFILMDFDRIDYSNLNRQYFFYDDVGRLKAEVLKERLTHINPDVQVKIYTEKVNRENINIFKNADVLAEAVDIAETKAFIVSFGAANKIFTVSSSGMAGYGDGGNMTVKRMGNVYITGDMVSEVSSSAQPYAPKVAIAAALEADIILAHFMDDGL